jgi:Zinc finger, C2H2 type
MASQIFGDGNWLCKFCKRAFATNLFYTNHMKTHLENVCYYCNHGFPSETQLMGHIEAVHHDQIVLKFFCTFCPKKFKNKKVLLNHKRQIHQTKQTVFFCGLCGVTNEKFFTRDGIQRHLQEHHSNERMLSDEPSTSGVSQNAKVGKVEVSNDPVSGEVHVVKSVHPKKQQPNSRPRNYESMPVFQCPKCCEAKEFQKTADLFLHLAEEHDEFVLVCDCGEKFNRKAGLAAHRKQHAKEFIDIVGSDYGPEDDVKSDQVCLLCDKNFGKNVSGLKYHVQCTHELEQSNAFACPYSCSKSFKASTNLISHVSI